MRPGKKLRTAGLLAAGQLPLPPFDPSPDSGKVVVRHTRDANVPTLLMRIEQAAMVEPHVILDLSGEISTYATSPQALDLVLADRITAQHTNPVRLANGLTPITLGYRLPDQIVGSDMQGLVDLAYLGIQRCLLGLTEAQREQLDNLVQLTRRVTTVDPIEDGDEETVNEAADVEEVTLVPIVPVHGMSGTVDPLVSHVSQQLEALVAQGMPGIDTAYVTQIVIFIEESASNIAEHAGVDGQPCEGFVAANRTHRRYHDHKRSQVVDVYTTCLACYDVGRGIFSALVSVPEYAATMAAVRETDRALKALRLAAYPGVSSKLGEPGRGNGLPRMVDIVRSLAGSGGDTYAYCAGLRLTSGGATLDLLSLSDNGTTDRVVPGTQLQLQFETTQRTNA